MRRKLFKPSTGFTLIELVMVIVILSILSVVVMPKFWDNSIFQARGFADQVLATLRYAQKSAIAQHQNVCVSLTSTTISLKIDNSACSTNLNLPATQSNILTAPSGITLTTTAASLTFNALGQASTAADITISNVTAHIFVEKETGYVYQ
jgi:MSHA pilin protein MshC